MSYGSATPSEPSMKKLVLIFGIIAIGAFIASKSKYVTKKGHDNGHFRLSLM
jgi:hypothetical protein